MAELFKKEKIMNFKTKVEEMLVDRRQSFIEYLRDENRHRIGVIAAVKIAPDTVCIGWSKCKMDVDKFDPDKGKFIALARAYNSHRSTLVPFAFEDKIKYIEDRARRYFKVDKVEWA